MNSKTIAVDFQTEVGPVPVARAGLVKQETLDNSLGRADVAQLTDALWRTYFGQAVECGCNHETASRYADYMLGRKAVAL